ncbi:hypothetical protein LJR009_001760 [Bosea sp. LjRoot9]|uniref:hypothetical protein n=1 Tax=Bosea sp. LjRoot9 TaxID=3342341 RepID=UPI003ECDB075
MGTGKPSNTTFVILLTRYVAVLAGAFLVFFGSLAACSSAFERNSFRYRLTVEIETPEGPKLGSGVVEIAEKRSWLGTARTFAKGEAVVVDLGAQGLLAVLLSGREGPAWGFTDATRIAFQNFADDPSSARGFEDVRREIKRYAFGRFEKELGLAQLPAMVRIRDASDPSTITRVDPLNFEAAFNSMASFKRATLETTRDAVTSNPVWKNWLVGEEPDSGRVLKRDDKGMALVLVRRSDFVR